MWFKSQSIMGVLLRFLIVITPVAICATITDLINLWHGVDVVPVLEPMWMILGAVWPFLFWSWILPGDVD